MGSNIVCRVQVCPTVLRQTVFDLFPYHNLEKSELSVVTIALKPDLKALRKNNEIETEKLAQTVSYSIGIWYSTSLILIVVIIYKLEPAYTA